MTTNDEVLEALWPTAEGDRGREAALLLLHAHGRWLRTLDAHGWVTYGPDEEDAASGDYNDAYAYVQWDRVADAIGKDWKVGADPASDAVMALRVGSGSEHGVLLLACSLAAGTDFSFHSLSSLDKTNTRLALRAVAHALQGRAYADGQFPDLMV